MPIVPLMSSLLVVFCSFRYADRAKQIVCKAIVNEDPNAKVHVMLYNIYN